MQFQLPFQISLITEGNCNFSVGISDIIHLIHNSGNNMVEERASICCGSNGLLLDGRAICKYLTIYKITGTNFSAAIAVSSRRLSTSSSDRYPLLTELRGPQV
jgi:hypothetical protein